MAPILAYPLQERGNARRDPLDGRRLRYGRRARICRLRAPEPARPTHRLVAYRETEAAVWDAASFTPPDALASPSVPPLALGSLVTFAVPGAVQPGAGTLF